MRKTYNQIRYASYAESDKAVTLRGSFGDYGGGSEVLVLQRRFSNVMVQDTEIAPTIEAGGGEGGNNLPMINVDVHHKDGNPENNSPENLRRLCRSCHLKAHRQAKHCSICGATVKGYGYCNRHYIRFKKYGNPLWVNGQEEVML